MGQSLLNKIKYAVRSRYSSWPVQCTVSKGLAYIITLYTITSLGSVNTGKWGKLGIGKPAEIGSLENFKIGT